MGKKQVTQTSQEETLKEADKVEAAVKKETKIRQSTRVPEGRVYVSSSYNNTIVTLTNNRGQVLASKSAGAVGFKGTKKSTSFAASRVAETIANVCMEKVEVYIKGIGAARESAIRTLVTQGINVVTIKDVTPVPHNGVRPKKVR